MKRFTAVLLAPALAGCSFIYNPNNLPDPRMIDAAVADANPCGLSLGEIAPAIIEEGQGDSGSPPALLVIHGDNIVNTNLKVDLKSHDGSAVQLTPITDAVASTDHTYLAFTVTAHVDTTLTTDVALDITVSQDAPQDGSCMGKATGPLSGKLTLHGLPELMSAQPIVMTTPLPASYSMVQASNVKFTGPAPAVVNAVSSISLGTVVADGVLTAPGPGANPGGASVGMCPVPGGGGGIGASTGVAMLLATGGGGGGAGGTAMGGTGTAGKTGLGAAGGAGGSGGIKVGSDQIVAFEQNAACAGGLGGNGGTLVLTGTPGAGGSGGGTVALIAGGNLQATSVSAKGGAGAPGASGGAGGGGGAGGNLMMRTDNGTLTITTIDVSAGPGGAPNGAAGSVGRVRWDAPGGNAPSAAAHRGLAFEKLATRMFTTSSPSFTVVGTSGDGFSFRVIDQDGHAFDGGHTSINNGLAAITPALHPGYNQVCITLDNGLQGHVEADKCIAVAFLP